MTVFLVGAGPGDPGLITVRGAELLAAADIVVHDRLSASELLDLAPASAERIDVGESPGRHRLTQDEINALLVERGRAGQAVVRLKGGDPFVFARGSDEAHALAEAGVAYEVVPGITSALAAPTYAGIPVTRRFSSTSFTVVTGHEDPASEDDTVDWAVLARTGGTLVILMGVVRWPAIAAALQTGGLPADTPAAAVRWGTRPDQHTTRATLATLADHELEAPSVIVVGGVAAEELSWFESRPLFGRRVVVTRTRAQASRLSARLRLLGAKVVEAPSIEIVDPSDGGAALRDAVKRISTFDWVLFTSPNGVRRTFAHMPDSRVLGGVKVGVIGPGTAEVLAEMRVVADLMPTRYVAEGLLDVFPDPPQEGGRVLVARAAVAREVLPDTLVERGWTVEVVPAYESRPVPLEGPARKQVADADAIIFMASSAVTNYYATAGPELIPPVVVTIGPVTSATARGHGLDVTAEAVEHTSDGVVAALLGAMSPPAGW